MSEKWISVSFADFIIERKDKYDPDAPEIQGLPKIEKIDFSGGKLHLAKYKPTKTKQIIVEPGDFVFSGLNIEKGAAGFNETGGRLVVSANYSTCSCNDQQVGLDFFKHYMRSSNFQKLLKDNLKKDYGFTRPKHLMPLSFSVPADKTHQEQIVFDYENNKKTNSTLESEITHQQTLLGKLKQSILQEAIQGKLTADWRAANPDVEPASELLQRIQEEKARLIAEKKIRKEKPLPEITPEEIPFEIPDGWEWCRLNQVASFSNGDRSTNYPSGPDIKESGVPFVNSKSIHDGIVDLQQEEIQYISEEKFRSLGGGKFQPLDIIMVLRGSGRGKSGILFNNDPSVTGFINAQLIIIRGIIDFEPKFVRTFLESGFFFSQVDDVVGGAAQPHISGKNLKAVKVPLPSLAEQAAIVERVEALMATCRELEAEIERSRTHATDLLQAVLKEAFAPAG